MMSSLRPVVALITVLSVFMSSCESGDNTGHDRPGAPSVEQWTDSMTYDLVDQVADGVYTDAMKLLGHSDPIRRYHGLYGYSSNREHASSTAIIPLISDTSAEVRQRAVFSAGQQHDPSLEAYLMQAFDGRDSSIAAQRTNASILQAIGKCGGEQVMQQLTQISNYTPRDSVLVLGQMRGLFQLMLRGYSDQAAQEKVIGLFHNPDQSKRVRTLAGIYLTRAPLKLRSSYEFELGNILRKDPNPSLRISAAKIIKRMANRKMISTLTTAYERENDAQVKYAILDALSYGPSSQVIGVVRSALKEEDTFLQRRAGELLITKGSTEQASDYWDASSNTDYSPLARHYLAAATARHLPFYYAITRKAAIDQLWSAYKGARSPWERIDILGILAYIPSAMPKVVECYDDAKHPAVKVAIIETVLASMTQADQLKKHKSTVRSAAITLLSKVIKEGAPGPLAAMTGLVQKVDERSQVLTRTQLTMLLDRMKSLRQPAELETYHMLVDLLEDYGIDSLNKPPPYNYARLHRQRLSKLRPESRAIVKTSKGEFKMALHDEICPQSVSNFIQLSEQGFFDGKAFHRVVPNFVAQVGCPVGDGYGSLDYAIRSEHGDLHYATAGAVGMASAGPDTESSQWFVTLQPTPHLDGRYTLFAQVTEGLEVVKKLRVGDKIVSVTILY